MMNLQKARAQNLRMQNNFSQFETSCFALFDLWAQKYGANFTIALSGGGDSLALCAIAQKWRVTRKNDAKLNAIIFDHAIAANSHEVANNALSTAKKIGIDAAIIRNEEKIETAIQETARKLRYQKILEFAASKNSRIILLGHNLEDQIETILFRMCRNTGIDGLSAMSELQNLYSPNFGTFYLARPLLGFSRGLLRQYLHDLGIGFYDDPANVSHKFARVRIRDFVSKNPSLAIDAILKIGDKARELRQEFNNIILKFLSQNMEFNEKKLTLTNFFTLPNELKMRILEILIQSFNYPNYRPKREKVEKILAQRLKAAKTLGGVKIRVAKEKLIFEVAPARKNTNSSAKLPNQKILDAICSYCS